MIARHGLVAALERPARRSRVQPNHGVRNHDRLHFSGALPGPACFDRVVKVQARLGKRRWQVFRTDRADEGCRFTARYKLRATRARAPLPLPRPRPAGRRLPVRARPLARR